MGLCHPQSPPQQPKHRSTSPPAISPAAATVPHSPEAPRDVYAAPAVLVLIHLTLGTKISNLHEQGIKTAAVKRILHDAAVKILHDDNAIKAATVKKILELKLRRSRMSKPGHPLSNDRCSRTSTRVA